ncbi:MAG: hypothetical protein ACJASB_002027 [Shewanella psychromarinicola]
MVKDWLWGNEALACLVLIKLMNINSVTNNTLENSSQLNLLNSMIQQLWLNNIVEQESEYAI